MPGTGTTIGLIKAFVPKPDVADITTAVDDWLDDHPEATTTVQDGAITRAKLDSTVGAAVDDVSDLKSAINSLDDDYYGVQSINVFNPNDTDIITNGYINSSGETVSQNNMYESGFIACEKDDTFTFSIDGTQVSAGSRVCVFYDSSKTFLSGSDYTRLPTITIPVVCAYFRIVLKKSEITGNLMAVKNDTSSHSYVPYGKVNSFKDNTNKAIEDITDDITEIQSAMSDFAEIDDTAGDGDTDKTWSANKLYDDVTAINSDIDDLNDDIYDTPTINLFNPNDSDIIDGKYLDSTGSEVTNSSWMETGYIPCTKGDTFTFYNNGSYLSSSRPICFYDSSKEFSSGSELPMPTITVSSDSAKYFRFPMQKSTSGTIMIVKNDTAIHEYVPYGTTKGLISKVEDLENSIPVNVLFPSGNKTDRASEIETILSTYGECVLSKGDFYISGIEMPIGTKLSGKGMSSHLIMLETTATGTAITPLGNNTISDLSIEREGGHSSRPSSGDNGESYGITCIYNVNQIRITNCDFKGFEGAGVYGYGSSSNDCQSAMIDNCRFLYCTTGIWFYGGMEYNSVVNCCCSACYYGVRNEGGNNLFSNCHFDKNYNAFEHRTENVSPANFGHGSVVGCTFNHCVSYAIYILGGDNGMVFSGCQIWYGRIYLRQVDGISFDNCEFGDFENVLFTFYGSSCLGNRFTNCTFNNTPSVTLSGSATTNAYIVNNCYMMDGTPVSFA